MFQEIYKNKKVLVTGHTGFKGSWLVSWLLNLGADVAGYSISIPTTPPVSKAPTNTGGAAFLVILPENADLFVDGKKSDRTGKKRLIFSPELVPGRLYSYTFKAIWKDAEEPKEEAREVFFRLGDELNVPLGVQK